jgi:predicted HAD superfamily phosphohydrolase
MKEDSRHTLSLLSVHTATAALNRVPQPQRVRGGVAVRYAGSECAVPTVLVAVAALSVVTVCGMVGLVSSHG